MKYIHLLRGEVPLMVMTLSIVMKSQQRNFCVCHVPTGVHHPIMGILYYIIYGLKYKNKSNILPYLFCKFCSCLIVIVVML